MERSNLPYPKQTLVLDFTDKKNIRMNLSSTDFLYKTIIANCKTPTSDPAHKSIIENDTNHNIVVSSLLDTRQSNSNNKLRRPNNNRINSPSLIQYSNLNLNIRTKSTPTTVETNHRLHALKLKSTRFLEREYGPENEKILRDLKEVQSMGEHLLKEILNDTVLD